MPRRRSLIDYPTFANQLEGIDVQLRLDGLLPEWAQEEDPDRTFEPIWPNPSRRRRPFPWTTQVTMILLGLLGAAAATVVFRDRLMQLF